MTGRRADSAAQEGINGAAVEPAAMPRPPGLPPLRAKRDDAAHRSHQDCFSESAQYEQLQCAENLHLFYFLRHGSHARALAHHFSSS